MKNKTYCSVEKCNNNSDIKPSFGFFRMPKNVEKSEKWIQSLNTKKKIPSDM
jgi:hypothetical protein